MEKEVNSVKQEQIHDILFNREIGWQEIIYDLINTEQLDPWNVDLTILSEKYLLKIQELEETDFFVSSKVLLAASLLLRIKSEILLNKYIKSIDDILFGKEEKKTSVLERIELDEMVPDLVPRSPMPRFKKVTLQELMESLNKAITTENRRIKKEIIKKNALRESSISMPKRKFGLKDRISILLSKISDHFTINKKDQRIHYDHLVGIEKEERIFSFGPLLQLENNKKIWLHQDGHFADIHVWERKTFFKEHGDPFAELKDGTEEPLEEFDESFVEVEEESEEEVEEK